MQYTQNTDFLNYPPNPLFVVLPIIRLFCKNFCKFVFVNLQKF